MKDITTVKQINTQSQTVLDEQEQDIAIIKQMVIDAAKYQKNPEVFSESFTDQAVIVNVAGIRMIGKEEIYTFMKKAKDSFLANVWVENEVIHITFLRADVAVVGAIQHIFVKNNDQPEEKGKGSLTIVMVKEAGKWLTAVGQNTLIQELTVKS